MLFALSADVRALLIPPEPRVTLRAADRPVSTFQLSVPCVLCVQCVYLLTHIHRTSGCTFLGTALYILSVQYGTSETSLQSLTLFRLLGEKVAYVCLLPFCFVAVRKLRIGARELLFIQGC
jgi:hypothetical protein